MRFLFIVGEICANPSPRCYPAYPSNSTAERAYSKRLLRRDYREWQLGQVRKNESFTHTERFLHRIFRCLGVCLAQDLCLLVKRIHLRPHKLGLKFDDFIKILGLAKFLILLAPCVIEKERALRGVFRCF